MPPAPRHAHWTFLIHLVLVYDAAMNSGVLSLLPDEVPLTFHSLPPAEQDWRGRLFLMVWILFGHEAYSWSMALAADPEWDAQMRQVVAETPDEYLFEVFDIAWDERRHW